MNIRIYIYSHHDLYLRIWIYVCIRIDFMNIYIYTYIYLYVYMYLSIYTCSFDDHGRRWCDHVVNIIYLYVHILIYVYKYTYRCMFSSWIYIKYKYPSHGGDQSEHMCISRLEDFPVHSFEYRGLPFTSVKTCLKFWGVPWKSVWKLQGLLWKLVWDFGSRTYLKSGLLCPWYTYVVYVYVYKRDL